MSDTPSPSPSTALARPSRAVSPLGVASADERPQAIVPRTPDEVAAQVDFFIKNQVVPRSYETMPAAKQRGHMIVAVMKGLELGMTPLHALQVIYVVNGIPTLYGDEIPARVMASGQVESWREWYEGEGDARAAFVAAKRRGVAGEMVRSFAVKNAVAQGLMGKKGPWQHSRDRMLMIRARTYLARDLFADALGGLGIKEEQEDIVTSSGGTLALDAPPTTAVVDPLADAEDAEFTEGAPDIPANAADAPQSAPSPVRWNGFEWNPEDPETMEMPRPVAEMTQPQLKEIAWAIRTLVERASRAKAEAWIEANGETLLRIAARSSALASWIREPLNTNEIAGDGTPPATGDAPISGADGGASPNQSEGGA